MLPVTIEPTTVIRTNMALNTSFYRGHRLLQAIIFVFSAAFARAAPPGGSPLGEPQGLVSGPVPILSPRVEESPADLPLFVDRPHDGLVSDSVFAVPIPANSWSLHNKMESWWGSWTTQVVVRDPGEDWQEPLPLTGWQTDQAVRLELAGPLFAFSQLHAGCECMGAREPSVVSRAGLGWKLAPMAGSELLVRGGPVVTCSDPLLPERAQEHSELKVEVEYRCPLAGPLRLEYQGSATPTLTTTDIARLNQDVRFALPLGSSGQFRLGAKHDLQSFRTPLPWTARMELYVGVTLGR